MIEMTNVVVMTLICSVFVVGSFFGAWVAKSD